MLYQVELLPVNGAPSRSRTRNLLIRSQTLYPIELWAHSYLLSLPYKSKKWWLRTESNCRHTDFQSVALPTELRSQKKWRSRRELNSRSSAWQADVITATPRDQKNGCGSWIWTNDLRVMSPTSYQAAPFRDIINGGERGIRTPAPSPTSRFSRPVPSTRLGYFSKKYMVPKAGLEPARGLTLAGF